MGTQVAAGPSERLRSAASAAAVLGLALLPSIGTLRAPWIAEDAAILSRVARDGPWADWTRCQYGLELWRFWRPLVSTSWALQQAWTGIDPVPLRLFNLTLHAVVALLAFSCARRLGLPGRAAFLAGAWVALFPEQGGTVTWLAGRTDLLAAVFLLASTLVALGPRTLASAPLAFLACASKEFGFLAPLWIALLARGRGETWSAALRRSAPAFLAVGAALLWRRAALGTFVGGYAFATPTGAAAVLAALRVTLGSTLAAWIPFALLAAAGLALGSSARRGLLCGLACAALGVLPLYPLLADGLFEAQNLRLFFVADCGLALAAGCVLQCAAGARRDALLALPVLLALGLRLVLAWEDTHDWARSARLGEEEVARARAALAGEAPAATPVFFAGFDVAAFDAYCLGFGLTDRFRAPFPATPRPLWPWRLAYPGGTTRERAASVPARADGSIRPFDDPRVAPELALELGGDGTRAALVVDERAFRSSDDRSERIAVRGGPAGAAIEALVITEVGYEPVPLGALDAEGAGALSLAQLLAQSNGVAALAELLALAADLGATRAYLEVRALDAAGGVLAASRWIELSWPSDLLRRSLAPAPPGQPPPEPPPPPK